MSYSEGLYVGLLSDTHGYLDQAIFSYFADCDEIWHAGDFGPAAVMDELQSFKPLRGVWGNVDGAEIRSSLLKELDWECSGMKVYMTHIGGYPGAWDKGAKAALARLRPQLVICGHSHILKVMREQSLGLLHLNPGAAGHNGWHTMRTMLRFHIDEGRLHGLEAIELGPRGRSSK
jgi:putative phosphoesterase